MVMEDDIPGFQAPKKSVTPLSVQHSKRTDIRFVYTNRTLILCMSLCPSIYLSAYFSACLPVYLYDCMPICMPIPAFLCACLSA